jgi:hypothetical protein
MNGHLISKGYLVTALVAVALGWGLGKTVVAQEWSSEVDGGMQVLTRGPVHEAFAETVTFDPEPGVVVPKAPPDSIAEIPPEQTPEGDNVAWIPGYWAWDDERSDFLWVSGIWRDMPPDRQWIPGYWIRSREGYQWVSGYWADAGINEIEYLPEPPETLDAGPTTPQPSSDFIWIPGNWMWHQGRFAWRPGYWMPVREDWVWVPAHYVWAVRGYVFVEGYWDYPVDRRGVLFAPVHFDTGVYRRRGFSYSPVVVVDLSGVIDHLFLRPRYRHYYFGDYYAVSYRDRGFYPWYSFYSSRRGYDPIYVHQRWKHRRDRSWEQRVQAEFKNRRDHEDARPPRTWEAQRRIIISGKPNANRRVVAISLRQLTERKDPSLRLRPVDKKERQIYVQRDQEFWKYRQNRRAIENRPPVQGMEKPSREAAPTRVRISRSPIVGKPARQFGKDQAPPRKFEAPKLDLKVVPRPKKPDTKAEPPRENPRGDSRDKRKG